MSTTRERFGWLRGMVAVAGAMTSGSVLAEYELNLTRGVTSLSRSAYDLHMMAFWVCVAIGVVVFGAMIVSIFLHRKSRGVKAAQFHHNTLVEIIWTTIPVLILVGMAIPTTRDLIALEENGDADLVVKVSGYQWKWKYDYLDQGVSFFSNLAASSRDAIYKDPTQVDHYLREVDNPVVLPVGKRIHFAVTANDVIHSWWVPDLGWKQDAIPGFVNDAWAIIDKPGVYRGQCAELCGMDHGFMPIVVKAVPEEEFNAWVEEQRAAQRAAAESADREWSMAELMEKGQQVYATNCVACHQANGQGIPPAFPALAGSPIATGPLDGHLDVVLHGREGTAMQAFGKQLSDVDLAAVITYERNAFGNDVGDLVQPAAIKAAKAAQ